MTIWGPYIRILGISGNIIVIVNTILVRYPVLMFTLFFHVSPKMDTDTARK